MSRVAVALVCLAACGRGAGNETPKDVIDAFRTAVLEADGEALLRCYTPEVREGIVKLYLILPRLVMDEELSAIRKIKDVATRCSAALEFIRDRGVVREIVATMPSDTHNIELGAEGEVLPAPWRLVRLTGDTGRVACDIDDRRIEAELKFVKREGAWYLAPPAALEITRPGR